MKRFLRMKHWQVFMLTCAWFGIIILSGIVRSMAEADANISNEVYSFIETLIRVIDSTVFLASFIFYVRWIYVVADALHKQSPIVITRLILFRVIFFLPLALMTAAGVIVFNSVAGADMFMKFLVPYYAVVTGLFLCQIYFVASALRSVELGRKSSFRDWVSDFFMIAFFPVGVWIVQPRINKIFVSNTNSSRDMPLDMALGE